MVLLAAIAWFALALQFYLMIKLAADVSQTKLQAAINYFSYFTILTNLLVAISTSTCLIAPSSAAGKFFSKPGTRTAIALYILMVGIVYSVALRNIWNPQGWQLIADRLLHDAVPMLFLIFWLISMPAKRLYWKQVFTWLIYPFCYLIYSFLRGLFTGWFAYPFLNAKAHGLASVGINILVIAACFLALGMTLVAINKIIPASKK